METLRSDLFLAILLLLYYWNFSVEWLCRISLNCNSVNSSSCHSELKFQFNILRRVTNSIHELEETRFVNSEFLLTLLSESGEKVIETRMHREMRANEFRAQGVSGHNFSTIGSLRSCPIYSLSLNLAVSCTSLNVSVHFSCSFIYDLCSCLKLNLIRRALYSWRVPSAKAAVTRSKRNQPWQVNRMYITQQNWVIGPRDPVL